MMKKSAFTAMILGTVSGMVFALGMCMALISEWDLFKPGIAVGVVGAVLALVTVIVYRRPLASPKGASQWSSVPRFAPGCYRWR